LCCKCLGSGSAVLLSIGRILVSKWLKEINYKFIVVKNNLIDLKV
jgi:hypothetical protein